MKAVVTSIGEPTIDLCIWALERNGFEVVVYESNSTLWEKLKNIYEQLEEDFLRVDADVIVNKKCTEEYIREVLRVDYLQYAWWVQFQTYDWYKQDLAFGGIQLIKKEALPTLRDNVDLFKDKDRPETELSRSYGMYNPRRFESYKEVLGLNGYGIKELKPIIKQKANRGQLDNYDFELTEELNKL